MNLLTYLMTEVTTNITKNAIKIAMPYDKDRLAYQKEELTKEIGTKKFSFYLTILKKITDQIDIVINSEDIMKDDYWDTVGIYETNKDWWTTSDFYKVVNDSSRSTLSLQTGVLGALSKITTDDTINSFVGKAPWMTGQQILFFQAAMGNYVKNNSKLFPVALNVDLAYYQSENENIQLRVGQAALSGSGPFILKLLQQIGNSASAEHTDLPVKELLTSIFNGVPAMGTEELKHVKEKMKLTQSVKEQIEDKSLGSASIAEAHKTNFHGVPAVVKFLKPAYVFYYLCECDFFLRTVWTNIAVRAKNVIKGMKKDLCNEVDLPTEKLLIKQTRQILLFFVKEFAGEFFYENEAMNTIAGFEVYNKQNQHVRSAQLLEYIVDPYPAIVQTLAPGVSLKSLLEDIIAKEKDIPEKKRIYNKVYHSLLRLRQLWMGNLFWGNGFFHADLHNGNIIVPTLDDIKKAIKDRKSIDLYLIDYGSAGKLKKEEQCNLIDTMLVTSKFKQLNYLIPSSGIAKDPIKKPNKQQDYKHLDENEKTEVKVLENKLRREENRTKNQQLFEQNARQEVTKFLDNACKRKSVPVRRLPMVCFFRDFDKLTCDQQTGLITNLTKEEKVIDKAHAMNVELSKEFIGQLKKVCGITKLDIDKIAPMILDYSELINFGQLFLDFVKYSSDIGACTNNSTLMFGRGIAYIQNSIIELWSVCDDEKQCRVDLFDNVITHFFYRHPKQIINFIGSRPVCSKFIKKSR
jgi:hypothetical protein